MNQINQQTIYTHSVNRFKELALLLPETAFQTDHKGRLTFVNETGFQVFGYEGQYIEGTSVVTDFFIPEERERVKQHLDLLLTGKFVEPHEYVALRKDGQSFPVIVHGNPIMEDGRCVGCIGLIIDLSYRKQIEKNLRTTEEKYHDIFENTWDAWCYHDLDGNFFETNFKFKKGFDLPEIEGRSLHIRDIVPEQYRQGVEQYLQEVKQNGKTSGIFLVRGKNGMERIIEYRATLVYDGNQPKGVRGMARDVTERIRAEKALKKSEQRYRSVFENAGLPMVIVENSLVIFMVNDRFVEMSGYEKDEIEGKMKFTDFIGSANHHDLMACLSRRKGDKPVEYECRVAHRNGERFDVLIRLGYIPEAGQFIASFTDITSRKQAELALLKNQEQLQKENIRLRSSIRERFRFCDIIGKSRAMQEVYEFILQASATQAHVIIYGESGTGKELVARAIHETSDRNQKGFVTVHCGAIPETLMESEFFGYKKGAFTGANIDKTGYLDEADGGTLFLDEVGEIGLNMQVKLLRAIAGGGFTPVGSSATKKPDVRIIAATNRHLRDLVRQGIMREDFFYRIHVLPIYLPPLRNRKEDLPLLIDYFLKGHDHNHPPLPGHITEALLSYDWPGNIRELQNVLQRYLTLKRLDFADMPTTRVEPVHLSSGQNRSLVRSGFADCAFLGVQTQPIQEQHIQGEESALSLKALEKDHIMKVLSENNWHRDRTAQALGISRKTLFLKMKKFDLLHS